MSAVSIGFTKRVTFERPKEMREQVIKVARGRLFQKKEEQVQKI